MIIRGPIRQYTYDYPYKTIVSDMTYGPMETPRGTETTKTSRAGVMPGPSASKKLGVRTKRKKHQKTCKDSPKSSETHGKNHEKPSEVPQKR